MTEIETERLVLRDLTLKDAPFILDLLNEPSWIENIGDKGVNNVSDAENYLLQGPLKSYQENGFGLYLIECKSKRIPMGTCGLIQREHFDYPDIGYALMPAFWKLGIASEAARGVLEFAKHTLNIRQVFGVTSLHNESSSRVLEKIGLKYRGIVDTPDQAEKSRFFSLHDEL